MEGRGPRGPYDEEIPDRSDCLQVRKQGARCVGEPIEDGALGLEHRKTRWLLEGKSRKTRRIQGGSEMTHQNSKDRVKHLASPSVGRRIQVERK